jgi:hypothetical protein
MSETDEFRNFSQEELITGQKGYVSPLVGEETKEAGVLLALKRPDHDRPDFYTFTTPQARELAANLERAAEAAEMEAGR